MDNELDGLLRTVRQAAGKLSPDALALDAAGNTRGDYESLLFWRSYVERAESRLEGEAKRLWVYKTTWNASRDMRRRRHSAAHRSLTEPLTEYHASTVVDPGPAVASVVEDRALIAFLAKKLPREDWDLLTRVSDANSVRDAYDPALGISLRSFYMRVRDAQARARRIVEQGSRC